MAERPRPLPRENEEVVFGVSSVLLTRTAVFWASEEDAEAERVDLGGGRRGGVPAVEAWRQAVARDLRALGLQVRTRVFQEGRMGSVFLAEVDDLELRRSLEQEEIAYGPGRAAERDLERRLPLFERYRAGLPEFVQRRHADALDTAQAKAERGIDARYDLYPRRPVHAVPPPGGSDETSA
ncbi:MAG: hypothetical protein ACRDLM_11935 [Gaiellaceae bacterium]